MSPLRPWHAAWLSAHPARTEGWLRERMADGFDVHHIDGDKANNAPANLALIEHEDHMRLHGAGPGMARLKRLRQKDLRPRAPKRSAWEKTRARMIAKLEQRGEPVPQYLLS